MPPKAWFWLVVSLVVLSGCNYRESKLAGRGSIRQGPPIAGLSYAKVYADVIKPKCANCHGLVKTHNGVNVTTYAGLMKLVKPKDPEHSHLIEVIQSGDMPIMTDPQLSPRDDVSDTELAELAQWIQQGAPEQAGGGPNPNPNPTPPPHPNPGRHDTFAEIYNTILKPKCANCHGLQKKEMDVDLTTYAGVMDNVTPKDLADSDLYQAVKDNDMPRLGKPLSPPGPLTDEEKARLARWINDGAPEK